MDIATDILATTVLITDLTPRQGLPMASMLQVTKY